MQRTMFDRRVRRLGFTRSQWLVLRRLGIQPGASQVELADLLEVEKATAGMKAFVTNRIGDAGLLLGIFTLYVTFGVIDFPSLRGERVVYLCWRMDEESITHWHETNAGFAGRQPLEDANT